MLWRNDQPDKTLTPLDALKIYALKTSPAFEAALYAGVRLAGPAERYEKPVAEFSRHLGVAFQILNDLKDWDGDRTTSSSPARTCSRRGRRCCWPCALESATDAQRSEIRELMESSSDDLFRLARLKELFTQLGAFETAEALVAKSRSRSTALARDAQPESLRSLLAFLIETVLADERQVSEARNNSETRAVVQAAHA